MGEGGMREGGRNESRQLSRRKQAGEHQALLTAVTRWWWWLCGCDGGWSGCK